MLREATRSSIQIAGSSSGRFAFGAGAISIRASVRSLAASRLGALEVASPTAIQRHRISAQGVASGSL